MACGAADCEFDEEFEAEGILRSFKKRYQMIERDFTARDAARGDGSCRPDRGGARAYTFI